MANRTRRRVVLDFGQRTATSLSTPMPAPRRLRAQRCIPPTTSLYMFTPKRIPDGWLRSVVRTYGGRSSPEFFSRRRLKSPAWEALTPMPLPHTITVHVPMAFRRRGGRKMVVMPDGAPWASRPSMDNAIVKALVRAFRWQRMLDGGVCGTIKQL